MSDSEAHPVKRAGGRPRHINAFEQIAVGTQPRCLASTLRWLEDHGLIERRTVVIGRDRFGDISVPSFSVPLVVHAQWCEWCHENCDDEV